MTYLKDALESEHYRAEIHTEGQKTITFTEADTDYQITDVVDGITQGFTLTGGTLTFVGEQETAFLFAGACDARVSSVGCSVNIVTFKLVLNGELVPECSTEVEYINTGRIRNFSCAQPLKIDFGDDVDVFARSTVAGTVMTITSFTTALWGR